MSSLVEACSDVVVMSRHLNNSVLPTASNVVAMSGQLHDINVMLPQCRSDVATLE